MTGLNVKKAAISRTKLQSLGTALSEAMLALYETVRCYVMPLMIGCLLVDLGFLTSAMTAVVSSPLDNGGQRPHDLIAANLYAMTNACTTALFFIMVGMCLWAMRSAFQWQMKRKNGGAQLALGDRVTIFVLEVLCVSCPITLIYGGLKLVRNTNFFLRHYLALPPVKINETDTAFWRNLARWGLIHPAAIILVGILLYTSLATLRIYVDDRKSRHV